MNGKSKHEMTEEEIGTKILHLLGIYPIISPTMLQGALGPGLKPVLWRPVLRDLIETGLVIQESESKITPAERYNDYAKLMLPGTMVTRDD